MYTVQKNPAAVRSQELICRAVCALMAELPFDEITVTRICQEAGVGRKTFYRNFEDKEDVILLMIDFLRAEYEHELPGVPPERAAYFHFSFLSRHMDFLILLETAGQTPLLTGRFSELQPRVMPRWSDDEQENAYRTAVVVAGTEAVIRLWARQGFRETPEELERLYRYALGAPAPEKSDRIEVNML
ncbi:MAG: TetR/AcrR family transcriptional regulator [Oscillospiraceae bacterium]|nr:TetR/AcrR family transcriptional regulator [Oscillospiraceae bacterium]